MPLRKQPRSEGQLPNWLEALGIGPGEWQMEAKPRLRRLMVDETWPEKARVWASLSLHSFGYSSEVAVTMDKGKPRLLTRADIARETGIDGAKVRRSLASLELEGWIERRSTSGKADLERGDIEIRIFPIPRLAAPVQEIEAVEEVAALPDGLPDELVRYLRRFKVRDLPEASILEKAKGIAHQLSELEGELRRVLRPDVQVSAPASTGTRADSLKNTGTGVARNRPRVRAQSKSGAIKSIGVKENERTAAAQPNGHGFKWKQAAAAVRRLDPTASDGWVQDFASSCLRSLHNAGESFDWVSDEVLALAVQKATRRNQTSAALYLKTVPVVLHHSRSDLVVVIPPAAVPVPELTAEEEAEWRAGHPDDAS
jgi:hypothetical protein